MEANKIAGISSVFIYLRKSRDEEEKGLDVLDSHKRTLLDICVRNGWKNIEIYQEIKSGSSLEYRTEMKRMLADIEKGMADLVLVMDTDRLSRGSGSDWEFIKSAFKTNSVFLMTPTATYDYNNIENEMMSDLLAVFSRYEFNQIKKRYKRGKISKAAAGHLTNGKPCYGYQYNHTTKLLELDPEAAPIVTLIKNMALDGIGSQNIAVELNKRGIKSPKGIYWTSTAILRMLKNKTYTGVIVFGKSSGSGHRNKVTTPIVRKPKSEWIVSPKVHPVLITDEEFEIIDEQIKKRTLIPERARKGVYPLSGLVRCKKCGRVHGFLTHKNKTIPDKTLMKPCAGKSPMGVSCGNRGIVVEVLYAAVHHQIKEYIERLKAAQPIESGRYNNLQIDLKAKNKLVNTLTNKLDRLNDLYIDGRVSKAKYETQFDQMTRELADAKTVAHELTEAIENYKGVDPKTHIKRMEEFSDVFISPKIANEHKNAMAGLFIDKVIFGRIDEEEPEIEVIFL